MLLQHSATLWRQQKRWITQNVRAQKRKDVVKNRFAHEQNNKNENIIFQKSVWGLRASDAAFKHKNVIDKWRCFMEVQKIKIKAHISDFNSFYLFM